MWVEMTDGSLVNLDGAQEVLRWQSPEADGAFNLSVNGLSGDGTWAINLINRATEAESEAALRRIRDALARGEKFVSLRETDSEGEAQVEELRNVLRHCLYRLEDNVQCLQSAGYYDERDATKIAVMRAKEVLGGLKSE